MSIKSASHPPRIVLNIVTTQGTTLNTQPCNNINKAIVSGQKTSNKSNLTVDKNL